jgi:hypothetical protein
MTSKGVEYYWRFMNYVIHKIYIKLVRLGLVVFIR